MTSTVRLTVGQAVVRFLAAQYSERDGRRHRLIAGCFGIFGHGNVAGVGQGLLEAELSPGPGAGLRYLQGRNEQAMVHAAAAFARTRNRLSTLACTSSVGPGATNMVTGAALATINRLPVLLLPGDVFATRVADPVLQQLEQPAAQDISVNDAFRPVSRFFDRIWRPEQLPSALLAAMRVLTDPAETGAVTLALPQDVQAEAYDWPAELFRERVWPVPRTPPDPASVARAAEVIRSARRPLIVAGGGVIYSEATAALRAFADAIGIPVGRDPGRQGDACAPMTRCARARSAPPGPRPPTSWPRAPTWSSASVPGGATSPRPPAPSSPIPGCGSSTSTWPRSTRRKQSGVAVVADARAALGALAEALAGWSADPTHRARAAELAGRWQATVEAAYTTRHQPRPAQAEVIGVVNEVSGERDVVVCAAGSMPGDLHKLWRTRDPGGYHVEYGYSCMGYEIAGGLGAKLAAPDREVFVMVGDGSYLMMATELVTAVQEGVKLVVVCVDNHGFASIGNLSESVGSQRFGTSYRFRGPDGRLDGGYLPVDLAANAASLGVDVLRAQTIEEFRRALVTARAADRTTLVHIETDPLVGAPPSDAWWDVPVAEVAGLASTRDARAAYEKAKQRQKPYL